MTLTPPFSSMEKRHVRPIADEQTFTVECGLDNSVAVAGYLTTEYGMGHGHVNALVGWTIT
ncbi:MAG TPA: hypothetical protein VIJ40_09735 [Acidimicrobiales bacterium]